MFALVGWAVLCGLVVDGACTDPGPPVDLPSPGTERAGYCGAIFSVSEWAALVGLPALAAALLAWPLRHRQRAWAIALGLIAAALLANACVAQSLPFAHTI